MCVCVYCLNLLVCSICRALCYGIRWQRGYTYLYQHNCVCVSRTETIVFTLKKEIHANVLRLCGARDFALVFVVGLFIFLFSFQRLFNHVHTFAMKQTTPFHSAYENIYFIILFFVSRSVSCQFLNSLFAIRWSTLCMKHSTGSDVALPLLEHLCKTRDFSFQPIRSRMCRPDNVRMPM